MDRFIKSFSMRKKMRSDTNESTKPQLWIEDEKKIKEGSCSFQVKYLGCIEVFESRGMPVCEEAIKALRKSKKKTQRAILFVSGDALRVSDEISKHLIVDQTIEKVSFCAPDRDHDKGFAYICRDGATRRWMCHAFLAVKESGERLSHAVGCAFAICLEKKQKREREAVQTTFSSDDASFVRMSSFRQATLTERLMDPQSAIIVQQQPTPTDNGISGKQSTSSANESVTAIVPFTNPMGPASSQAISTGAAAATINPGVIPRPHASPSLIERQTSLRLFPKLQEASPFKQSLSMRVIDPSTTLQRMHRALNGVAIPEEAACDFNASFDPNYAVVPSLSMGSSLDPPTSPDTFLPVTSMMSSGPKNLTNGCTVSGNQLFVKTLSDPFSAAPFNPETIQQHHVAQKLLQTQQQLQTHQQIPEPISSPRSNMSSSTASAIDGFADWSLVPHQPSATPLDEQQPQKTVVPQSNAIFSASQVPPTANTVSYGMTLFGITSTPTSAVKTPTFSDTQWNVPTNWTSNSQPILPPEPNRFTDPFDIEWADRATAIVSGQLAHSLQLQSTAPSSTSNPFLTSQMTNESV